MNTILEHYSGVRFKYLRKFTPQFTKEEFVELLNLKNGKKECFKAKTYSRYFRTLEKEN